MAVRREVCEVESWSASWNRRGTEGQDANMGPLKSIVGSCE